MICPQCGYDMGNKSKCLRCGYEVKTLAVVDDDREHKENDKKKEEKDQVIDIDPMNVFLTHPYGYEDDFGTGYGAPIDDPFVSLIDSIFGDPIGDLLGGLFGFDMSPPRRQIREDPPPVKKKKQGPIYVIDDIEIIEPGKEKKESDKKDKKEQDQPKKSESKIKYKFKNNNKRK